MTAWLATLVLSLLISLTATIPGTLDARMSQALTRAARERVAPGVTATVHLDGDPVFQLPWGVVPHMTVHLHGLQVQGFPLADASADLTHVHINSGAVLGHEPARLLEPAGVTLAVRLARADVQTRLSAALAKLPPQALAFDIPLLGHITPTLSDVRVRVADGRVVLDGLVALRPGAKPRSVSASFGFDVLGGRRLVVTDPHVALGGVALPSMLLAPLTRRVTLLDVRSLPLPDGRWTLQPPLIDADGLELRVAGTVTQLPDVEELPAVQR